MSKSNYDRAKQVLQSSVQGIHPATRTELPEDSVVNNAEVLRAIVVAVSVLGAASLRATRRAMLPKSGGEPWMELEDATLTEEFARGSPIDDIAKGHHRTLKLSKHGLKSWACSAVQRLTALRYSNAMRRVRARNDEGE